ncbi:MAG: crossover junction endodeoxyribonuclease RuvC [Candidatus Eisenbacteria bacterium]
MILGIDPGTRFIGIAVVQGKSLLDFSVHEIRNGTRPYDLIGQARGVVLRYVERFGPRVVAIEAPYMIATKRGALLSTIAQELHERSLELGIQVGEVSPEVVRERITGNPRATKIDVAENLVETRFGELRRFVPKRPVKSALGLRPRDKYWLHAFDALALAMVTENTTESVSPRWRESSPAAPFGCPHCHKMGIP